LAGWAAGVVGGDVVEVAGPGAAVTVRELAVLVTDPDLGGHPLRWVVPVDCITSLHVDDHGGDGGDGAVPAQPVTELLDEDRTEPVGAGHGQPRRLRFIGAASADVGCAAGAVRLDGCAVKVEQVGEGDVHQHAEPAAGRPAGAGCAGGAGAACVG